MTLPDSDLPRGLELVRLAANRLDALLQRSAHSDLRADEPPPTSLGSLQQLVRDIVEWRVSVFTAYGTLCDGEVEASPEEEEAQGVLWHFFPADGPFTEGHPSLLVGQLPEDLRDNPVATLIMSTALCDQDGNELAICLDNWPAIRSNVLLDLRRIGARGTKLVKWVRQAIAAFQEPDLPEVVEREEGVTSSRGSRDVVVRHRGRERVITLQRSIYLILRTLAVCPQARDTRKNKSELCRLIPEIEHYVQSVDPGREQLGETECVYRLDPAMQNRVLLTE